MSEASKSTAVTEITKQSGYSTLSNREMLNDALNEDCQGLSFTFDRVKIPAGGGTTFEIPSADSEETESVKELTGVIVFNHPAFAFYHEKYKGGSNPPDCGSFDGVTGVGNPGGSCNNCPYNKFGSGDGQSKLCKNKRMLYILREGELFPLVLTLPTGSLRTFTNYVKGLLTKGRKLSQVVTRITLKKATSSAGIVYSQAVLTFVRMLNPEESAAIADEVESVKAYAANLTPASMVEDESTFVDPETGEIIHSMK